MGSSFWQISCHYLLLRLLFIVLATFSLLRLLLHQIGHNLRPRSTPGTIFTVRKRQAQPSKLPAHETINFFFFLQRVWSRLRAGWGRMWGRGGTAVTNKLLSVNERRGKEVGRQSVINLAAVGSFILFIPTEALRLKLSLLQTEMGGERRCAELCVHFVWKNAPKSQPTEDELAPVLTSFIASSFCPICLLLCLSWSSKDRKKEFGTFLRLDYNYISTILF